MDVLNAGATRFNRVEPRHIAFADALQAANKASKFTYKPLRSVGVSTGECGEETPLIATQEVDPCLLNWPLSHARVGRGELGGLHVVLIHGCYELQGALATFS